MPSNGEFPLCDNSGFFDNTFNGGANDVFIGNFSRLNSLKWSTYIGGGVNSIESEAGKALAIYDDKLYLVGYSGSDNNNSYPQVLDNSCYFQQYGLANTPTGITDGIVTRFNGLHAIGMEETLINNNLFSVFPNPGNGLLNIELDVQEFEKINLLVYNNLGEIILKENKVVINGKNKFNLNLLDKPNGLYLVSVLGENTSFSKRFIIQK